MALTIDKVRAWRAYAEDIRLAAAGYRSQAARQGVLAAAQSYEELANSAERWLRSFSRARRPDTSEFASRRIESFG
jgi:hypothetical protein